MSHQNKTQAPMHNPDQKLPGQRDGKNRQVHGAQANDPRRPHQNPGVKNPGHEHDH